MTRVDFYGLNTADDTQRLQFACRLILKAFQHRHRILVRATDRAQAEVIDELLWQFDATSFIPHALADENPAKPPPVQITWLDDALGHHDVLVNLDHAVPSFYARFKRILEVVATAHADAEAGRNRFRFYKERGHPLHFHQQAVEAPQAGEQ